ncbi:MAG: histidine kinase, partial [Acetatifactor sp.]|nr:histidine kinase [Acetatifactor sp.]
MEYIRLINLVSVGVFGMILSASFCDTLRTRKKRLAIAVSMAVILAFQVVLYFWVGQQVVDLAYPLITHFPLAVVLCILNRKKLWPIISVLTAYFCCQLRRWLAVLIVAIFSGGTAMQDAVELVIT